MSRASIFLTQLLARQQAGWESPEPVLVEDIVREQPELAARPEELLDLIYAEIHYREQSGNKPAAAEYLGRFPQFATELTQLFELHQALGGEATFNLETHDSRSQIAAAGETMAYEAKPSENSRPLGSATGRYQIVRPHAKGGLGEVFVAKDLELGREVALKQIQTRYADYDESRGRFVQEAEITGGLEHPGIVPVYGLGTYADGRPYYAMRFIRGVSLEESIQKLHTDSEKVYTRSGQPTVELRKLLQRFIDVCNAIGYAHSRGIIHRDLKPGNVMLGNYGETLVVDWGLAKSFLKHHELTAANETVNNAATATPAMLLDVKQSDLTQDGSTLGTPAYMSPEQAAGQTAKLGPASDIYSLGATLYAFLTGKPPHQIKSKDSLPELLRRVQAGEFPRPREVQKRVPKSLEAICLRAMAVDPTQRYASCQALTEDLDHFLADEPVGAKRETLVERFGRLTRRHRGVFLATTAALLLITLGSVLGAVLLNAAKERESDALAKETKARQEETQAKNDALTAEQRAEKHAVEANQAEIVAKQAELVAKEESAKALAAEREAHAAEERTQQQLYFSNIGLAYRYLQEGELDLAEKFLNQCPSRFRHWEWDFLIGVVHRDRKPILPGYGPGKYQYSPDGRYIALAETNQLAIWDDQINKTIIQLKINETNIVGLDFAPDSNRIAWIDKNGPARILNNLDATNIIELEDSKGAATKGVAFSHDGTKVAIAYADQRIRIWDSAGGKLLKTVKMEASPLDVVWHKDNQRLITINDDSYLRLQTLDGASNKISSTLGDVLNGCDLSYRPETDTVSLSCNDPLRTWRLINDQLQLTYTNGKQIHHFNNDLSKDGRYVAVDGYSSGYYIYDQESNRQLMHLDSKLLVNSISISPNGEKFVSTNRQFPCLFPTHVNFAARDLSRPGNYQLHLGTSNNYLISAKPLTFDTSNPNNALNFWGKLSNDQRLVLRNSEPGSYEIIDTIANTILKKFTHPIRYLPIPISADFKFIVNKNTEGKWQLYDLYKDTVIHQFDKPLYNYSSHFISPDNRYVFSFDVQGNARVFKIASQQTTIHQLGQKEPRNAVAFSSDGLYIATGSGRESQTIRLWKWPEMLLLQELIGHNGNVHGLSFSRDSKRLASSGGDGTLRIWEPHFGKELLSIEAYNDIASSVEFVADDRIIITQSARGQIAKLWGGLATTFKDNKQIDLLPYLRPYSDSLDKIVIDSKKNNTRYSIPIVPNGSYVLRAKFTRTNSGNRNTLGFILPVGTNKTMLVFDHEATGMSGLDQLNGQGINNSGNSTNPTNTKYTLQNHQPIELVTIVKLQNEQVDIKVSVNHNLLFKWSGNQSSCGMYQSWDVPTSMGIGLGEIGVTFDELSITPISSTITSLQSPTISLKPLPPSNATVVKVGNPIDLLENFDLKCAALDLKPTTIDKEGLVLTSSTEQAGRIQSSISVHGSYEINWEFTCPLKDTSVSLIIPVGLSRCSIEPTHLQGYGGISYIKKIGLLNPDNPTRTESRLTPGKRYQLTAKVVLKNDAVDISVLLDGKPYFSWSGLQDDLSLWKGWQTPHPHLLALGCRNGTLLTHALTLKMLDGEAWILKPAKFPPDPSEN